MTSHSVVPNGAASRLASPSSSVILALSSLFLRNEKMFVGLPLKKTGLPPSAANGSNGSCQYLGLLARLSRSASFHPPSPSFMSRDWPDWKRFLAWAGMSATASVWTAPDAKSLAFHASAARYSSLSTRCTSFPASSFFHFGGTRLMIVDLSLIHISEPTRLGMI